MKATVDLLQMQTAREQLNEAVRELTRQRGELRAVRDELNRHTVFGGPIHSLDGVLEQLDIERLHLLKLVYMLERIIKTYRNTERRLEDRLEQLLHAMIQAAREVSTINLEPLKETIETLLYGGETYGND